MLQTNAKNSESASTSKGRRRNYSVLDDVNLLKEVIQFLPMCKPYKERSGLWKKIQANLKDRFSVQSMQDRYKLLMEKFEKEDMNSLKSSGTEEEFDERRDILQDIKDQIVSDQLLSKTSKVSDIESSKKVAEQIRDASMKTLKDKNLDSGDIADSPTAVFDRKRKSLHDVFLQCSEESNKVKKQELDLKKMELDLQVKRLENDTRQRDLDRELETRRIAIQEQMLANQNDILLQLLKKH
ncbi:unnamed protein product [Allacma fusca]|uniref:Uncharacterized protein n=1 Tax=Allacma fusca TaxID=39272 RepID=A0A8J2NRJ7_9HEXA|nr:unnamed protein product [Allacma fusca]